MEGTLPVNSGGPSQWLLQCVFPGCSQYLHGFQDCTTHWQEVHHRANNPMATLMSEFSESAWLPPTGLEPSTAFNILKNNNPYSHRSFPELSGNSAQNRDTFTPSEQSQPSFDVDTVPPSYTARPDSQTGHLVDEHVSETQSNDFWCLATGDLYYYCNVCPAQRKQPKPFARHLLQHLDDMLELPYYCSSCNKNGLALFEQLSAHRCNCALFFCDRWGCHKVFRSRSSLSMHESGQDGSACLERAKQKEADTWNEVLTRLLSLGAGSFALPTGIIEGAEPARKIVAFLEKRIGSWNPSF
ncbi:hypothetical protein AOQ84DRAFT_66558 [Glonium stellatum]|uniref:C2H2-type domain-containing protein n=1 Tax=Glonium stellatum TaxID=574774 RepID=A0A8E2JRR7_9PEZI|nr:hypothetical protein AOQ84DRAFT_66558 [Glonium stellatum]